MGCLTATERVQFPLLSCSNPGRYVKDIEVDTDEDETPACTPPAQLRAEGESLAARVPRKLRWERGAEKSQQRDDAALKWKRPLAELCSRPKQKSRRLVLPASSAETGRATEGRNSPSSGEDGSARTAESSADLPTQKARKPLAEAKWPSGQEPSAQQKSRIEPLGQEPSAEAPSAQTPFERTVDEEKEEARAPSAQPPSAQAPSAVDAFCDTPRVVTYQTGGETIADEEIVEHDLIALPESYEGLVNTIMYRPTFPRVAELTDILLQDEIQREIKGKKQSDSEALFVKSKNFMRQKTTSGQDSLSKGKKISSVLRLTLVKELTSVN
ncbi:hypothetical protein AXG93_2253s1290 [Marchantia polymorpha subsp. ruderalis]|uniref:Uncharacterized protein n=1 Tax=Marchantia polymorpha subsp. ruderalis TaxID=1480154 RepID=A0A176VSJ9_MARPO|nr:hypothetical protein AXG93_2253s1290 [Marchantia polymorpha subsp. ruderalis]